MKDTAKELKKYFRKCRQLNQILILILPMFFELPRFYALGRSHCLVNVKFLGEFDRGFFDFYGPSKKKDLYLKGKRDWNYNAVPKDFDGRFFGSYTFFPNVNEETKIYIESKFADMKEDNGEELSAKEQLRDFKIRMIHKARDKWGNELMELIDFFEIPRGTYYDNKKRVLIEFEKIEKTATPLVSDFGDLGATYTRMNKEERVITTVAHQPKNEDSN